MYTRPAGHHPRTLALGLLAAVLWIVADIRPVQAIPAHGRAQGVSCTHCHQPFPRLTEAGMAFLRAGFSLPQQADNAPQGKAGGSVLGRLPLGLRGDLGLEFRPGDDKGTGFSDFKTPLGLRLFSAGQMAEGVAFAIALHLSDDADLSVLEDAFLRFDDVFGSGLDITVGQFPLNEQVFSDHRRLTFQPYLPFQIRTGLSRAAFGHDRGLRLDYDFDFGLSASALVVNGSGTDRAEALRDFDSDQYKNVGLRLAQRLGPIRLGAVAYWGKERSHQTITADGEVLDTDSARFNEVFIWGPDLVLELGPAQITGQYLQRRDLNPNFESQNEVLQIITHSYVIEATARLLRDKNILFLTALFNLVDSSAQDDQGRTIREEAYTLNLTWCMFPNLKLMAEYTFSLFRAGEESNENRITLGLIGAL